MRSTYALIIDPVSVSDTSPSYQCHTFVTNPITNTKQRLQLTASDANISLTVDKFKLKV